MGILEPRVEKAEREALRLMQLERLQATVNRAYRHVRFYRESFDRVGVLPEDIKSLDDLARFPFTARQDLLDHQPYGLFAVPLHDVVRLHPAAGAGGPVMVGYTRNDMRVWSHMAARALVSAGVTKEDVIQITLDYAVDAAATGAQSGAEELGASFIPCAGLSPERQVDVMCNYRATALAATPPQALQLGAAARQINTGHIALRVVFIAGEVWSEDLRREIEGRLPARACASYGMSEMAVPGMATECEERNGLHISEDNVFAEVVNPKTGERLPHGERGELVLTTLTREAVPMLRYRTGDLTILDEAPCPCGRTLLRMQPTHARADDMVIVDGVRVWPDQITEVVRHFLSDASCRMEVKKRDGREVLEVRIAVEPSRFIDTVRDMERLKEHIRAHLIEHLGLNAEVRLVEPERGKKPRIQ